MSQVMDRGPAGTAAAPPRRDANRTRRLVLAIVALGLLLGAVAGWSAFALISSPSPDDRGFDAQRARWEGLAEEAADARRLDVERQRWEGQADRFAPGWRER
jgi:hypothetical protein